MISPVKLETSSSFLASFFRYPASVSLSSCSFSCREVFTVAISPAMFETRDSCWASALYPSSASLSSSSWLLIVSRICSRLSKDSFRSDFNSSYSFSLVLNLCGKSKGNGSGQGPQEGRGQRLTMLLSIRTARCRFSVPFARRIFILWLKAFHLDYL